MTGRLINADELLEELKKSCKWHAENSRELSLLQRDINIVKEQPTVDAEPVRHGRWIMNDNGTYSCSECHSWIPNEQHYYARYCLFCGAKMDGCK